MNIGTASARLERGFAAWLQDDAGINSVAASDTETKAVPVLVCESGEVVQPAWPHNFFEGQLSIHLQTCAPETSRDQHSEMEEELNLLLADAHDSAEEINELRAGITVTGWRVESCKISFDENRTITTWVLSVDFSAADPATS